MQQVLISQKIGENTENLAAVGATGFFGDITKNTLAKSQRKAGLPTYGYFD